MDLGSLIGVLGALAMMILGVVSGGSGMGTYADLPSLLIVVLGSWFCLMASSSIGEAVGIFKVMGLAFSVPNFGEKGIVTKLMAFSDKARREGLLALEEELEDLDDEFMKKGLRLVVDGTDAAIVRDLLEIEVSQMQDRHGSKIGGLNMWAALAPGFGMLGTVIGLIAMMKNLEDKASVGPNMAVALITTLYGSMIANWLLTPLIAKLRANDGKEAQVREMIIEGILSIQAGDNPRILGMKLVAYLSPEDRKEVEQELNDK
ncbi:MAG: MotA/TolQ/ExbB proton channel family protein [Spirochaetaceae bacterium]|jgi:chemotaxis protein MotA|nr:MotA/TolQ/ExbB proton channel family protein [Spirochaetaceae bacterium]